MQNRLLMSSIIALIFQLFYFNARFYHMQPNTLIVWFHPSLFVLNREK